MRGFYAYLGSSNQTACSPGTVQPEPNASSCDKCREGTYQDAPNGTACKPCDQGYYCRTGASVALPCKAGTYTIATNLTSADECTNTTEGYYAAAGSKEHNQRVLGCLPRSAHIQVLLQVRRAHGRQAQARHARPAPHRCRNRPRGPS